MERRRAAAAALQSVILIRRRSAGSAASQASRRALGAEWVYLLAPLHAPAGVTGPLVPPKRGVLLAQRSDEQLDDAFGDKARAVCIVHGETVHIDQDLRHRDDATASSYLAANSQQAAARAINLLLFFARVLTSFSDHDAP